MTEEKIKTRDKILEAARAEFQQKGYTGTRMQQIADRAGINKGLLHYYFKSKDKIFEKILSETFKLILETANRVLSKESDIFDKIEEFLFCYMSLLEKNSFAPSFAIQEINRNPGFLRKNIGKMAKFDGFERFQHDVEKAISEDKIHPISHVELFMNMISMAVFPIIAEPMILGVMKIKPDQYKDLIKRRHKTVSQFVINAIKK